jgi:hypothetical protein
MSRRTWTAVHSAVNRSLKLAELNGHAARLFFHQLLQAVDSHGCIDARPHILLVEVWPLLGETIASTEAAARELERVGLVVRKREDGVEWLEIPDWNDKAGALIRKRGKRIFGTDKDGTRTALGQHEDAERAEIGNEGRESLAYSGDSANQSSTASNSRSNSPSRSSLADHHSLSPRVSRTRTREESPSTEKPAPPPSAREQIGLYPALDVPAMHAAAMRWEVHMRENGKTAWGASTWGANLARWERWGSDRAVIAIDTAIRAGKFTPFEPKHESAGASKAASEKRVGQPTSKPEDDLRDRWTRRCGRMKVPDPTGRDRMVDVARDYPGDEVARAELEAFDEKRSKVSA